MTGARPAMNVLRLDPRRAAAGGPPGFAEGASGADGGRAAPAGSAAGQVAAPDPASGFVWRVISPASGVMDALARPAASEAPGPERGALVMECRFDDGLGAARTLLRCPPSAGDPRAPGQGIDLAVIADPVEGIGLFLRRGADAFQARAAWPGGDGPTALMRLTFQWDGAAGGWTLAIEDCTGERRALVSGSGAAALPIAHLGALCAAGMDVRDPSVVWLALGEGRAPLGGLGRGLGADAMVLTPAGHVAAARLKAGDMVVTRDRGAQPVRAAGVVEQPAYGANVPVILRANYLGARLDLRLLPRQRIAMAGAEVEYLFGEDEVLVEAGYFVDDRTVMRGGEGGAMRLAYVLLDEPELICANGCWVESPWPGADAAGQGRAARRVLKAYEARTLAALRQRAGVVI